MQRGKTIKGHKGFLSVDNPIDCRTNIMLTKELKAKMKGYCHKNKISLSEGTSYIFNVPLKEKAKK